MLPVGSCCAHPRANVPKCAKTCTPSFFTSCRKPHGITNMRNHNPLAATEPSPHWRDNCYFLCYSPVRQHYCVAMLSDVTL